MMLQEQEFTLSHSYGIRDEGRKEGQENVNNSQHSTFLYGILRQSACKIREESQERYLWWEIWAFLQFDQTPISSSWASASPPSPFHHGNICRLAWRLCNVLRNEGMSREQAYKASKPAWMNNCLSCASRAERKKWNKIQKQNTRFHFHAPEDPDCIMVATFFLPGELASLPSLA